MLIVNNIEKFEGNLIIVKDVPITTTVNDECLPKDYHLKWNIRKASYLNKFESVEVEGKVMLISGPTLTLEEMKVTIDDNIIVDIQGELTEEQFTNFYKCELAHIELESEDLDSLDKIVLNRCVIVRKDENNNN